MKKLRGEYNLKYISQKSEKIALKKKPINHSSSDHGFFITNINNNSNYANTNLDQLNRLRKIKESNSKSFGIDTDNKSKVGLPLINKSSSMIDVKEMKQKELNTPSNNDIKNIELHWKFN